MAWPTSSSWRRESSASFKPAASAATTSGPVAASVVRRVAGAAVVPRGPGRARRVVKQLGVLSAVITLVLVLAIIGGFQHGGGNLHLQFEAALRWIPSAAHS